MMRMTSSLRPGGRVSDSTCVMNPASYSRLIRSSISLPLLMVLVSVVAHAHIRVFIKDKRRAGVGRPKPGCDSLYIRQTKIVGYLNQYQYGILLRTDHKGAHSMLRIGKMTRSEER